PPFRARRRAPAADFHRGEKGMAMSSKKYPFLVVACLLLLPVRGWAQQALVPAANVQTAQQVRVTDFGARPDDGRDDTVAVLAAIAFCRKFDKPTLVFPKGRYDIFAGANPDSSDYAFVVEKLANLTIDGQGSTLIFHGLTAGLLAKSCQGFTIRNLTI